MKHTKQLYIILSIAFMLSNVMASTAQNQKDPLLDSLQAALRLAKADTSKVNLLYRLYKKTEATDTVLRLQYINDGLTLAEKLKWKKGLMLGYYYSGIYYNLLANYPKAISGFQNYLLQAGINKDTLNQAEALLALGVLYEYLGYYSKSIEYLRQISLLKPDLEHVYTALGNMGIVYGKLSDYPKALECYEASYKMLAESINATQKSNKNDTMQLIGLLSSIGDVYISMADYDKAIINFNKILELNVQINNTMIKVWANAGMAKAYHLKNDHKEASKFYETALEEAKSINSLADEAMILNELGNIALETGAIDKGVDDAMQSLAIDKRNIQNPDPDQAPKTYITLGRLFSKKGDHSKSQNYLMEAIELCKKSGSLDIEKDAWLALSNTYEQMKQSAKAFDAYKHFVTLCDSVYSQEKARQLTRIDMQGDFDRKQLSDSLQQAKKDVATGLRIQRQRLFIYGGFTGLALVLLLSFFIYRNYNNEKKANIVISKANETIKQEKQISESLLLNILPEHVADELKTHGSVEAKQFDEVTVLFTDFVSFTTASERMTPKELVAELHACFKAFDGIARKHGIEKIKTVGDAYLAVAGLPKPNPNHATDIISAAMEIRDFMTERKRILGDKTFGIRLGLNSGPVVAGIVGDTKFAYDIWGDTVNTAARMEQNSEEGQINITDATYQLIKDKILCSYRGEVAAKNKGKLKMYFVDGFLIW